MKQLRIPVFILIVLGVIYAADDLSIRYRIPKSRQLFDTVAIHRYDAIAEKNNKTEFVYEDPINETCVRSIVPHIGYVPCWYLRRHSEQRINY